MTNEELQAAQSRINELETQAAALREGVRDGIDRARQINAGVRDGQARLRQIDIILAPLKGAALRHLDEQAAAAAAAAAEPVKE